MEKIIKLRESLEKSLDDSSFDKALEYLKKANDLVITKDILKSTEIGKVVGKLRNHKDIAISKQSSILIDKWKKDIDQPTTTKSTSSSTNSDKTNIKNNTNNNSLNSPSSAFKRKSSDTVQTTTTTTIKTKEESNEERPNKRVFEEKKVTTTSTVKTNSLSSSTITTTTSFKCTITPIKIGSDAAQRNKMIQLLVDSMTTETDDTLSSPEDVATEIEAELYSIYRGTTNDYKNKVRSFIFNLKSNEVLRNSLLNRRLMVEKFCSMDVMSMASDELKEERRKLDKFQTEASMIGNNNEATTDQFQCGKCKQRKCTYFQMQTRSADEPMTTFVRCINCGNRWKFC